MTEYIVSIDPGGEHGAGIQQILIKYVDSEHAVSDLIESGGVVFRTDDESAAEDLVADLRSAGAEVEIERREPHSNAPEEHVDGEHRSDHSSRDR